MKPLSDKSRKRLLELDMPCKDAKGNSARTKDTNRKP